MVYRKVPIYRKRWIVCTYTKSEPPCIIESGWLGFTNSPTTSSTGGWILPSKGAVLLLAPKGGVTSIVTGPLTKRYFLNPLSLILPVIYMILFVKLRVKCIEITRVKVLLCNAECFAETGRLK